MANEQAKDKENGAATLHLARLFPNMVTLLGLCIGLSAMRFALLERWEMAVGFIVLAACIDAMDGRLARLLHATSNFGAQLDSLADFINFGVAPAFILYQWKTSHLWEAYGIRGLGWGIVLFFAVCCALRLARFNSDLESEEPDPLGGRFFTGIPSPGGALLALFPLAATFAFARDFPGFYARIDWMADPLFVAIYAMVIAVLMASRMPTISFKAFSVPRDHAWLALMGAGVFMIALVTEPWLTLVLFGVWYVAMLPFGVIRHYQLLRDIRR